MKRILFANTKKKLKKVFWITAPFVNDHGMVEMREWPHLTEPIIASISIDVSIDHILKSNDGCWRCGSISRAAKRGNCKCASQTCLICKGRGCRKCNFGKAL